MPGFEYMAGNAPFTFPMRLRPYPGSDYTAHMIPMSEAEVVWLLWKARSFKISGASLHVPDNGKPFGGVTDSYADFFAPSSRWDGQWGTYESPQHLFLEPSPVFTPREDSGRAFIGTPQVFAGGASENTFAPQDPSGSPTFVPPLGEGWPAVETPYRDVSSCFFIWGPFASARSYVVGLNVGTELKPLTSIFYDPEESCYWVSPPTIHFSHAREIWTDSDFGPPHAPHWVDYSNAVMVSTDIHEPNFFPGAETPVPVPAGTGTLSFLGRTVEFPLLTYPGNSPVGTDTYGLGVGVTASATIEIHEEWDYS